LQTSNCVQRLSFNLFKLVAKLIDNNINLLNINKFCIVKTKERLTRAKNRKSTIIRAKKTKIKSIKRDFFSFEYVNVAIKVLRNSKDAIERDNNRDKTRQKKQKKLKASIVATINKNIDKIYEDIRDIIIKQTTRIATKKTTTIFAILAISTIIKTIVKKII